MKRTSIVLGLIFNGLLLFGQEPDINAEKFSQTITASDLEEHLKVIASDEFEGRETGKKGQKMAMKYLINYFQKIGIEDYNNQEYIQSFALIEQQAKGVSLKIGDKDFMFNKDFVVTPNVLENVNVKGEIIFLGHGIDDENYSDYTDKSIEGKAVFIWNGAPKKVKLKEEWDNEKKIALAKEKGAIAIFFYNEKLTESLTKYEHYYNKAKITLADDFKKETPVIYLTEKASEYILKLGKSSIKKASKKGIKKVKDFSTNFELDINKPMEKLSGENVLAFIPGNDKKEEIVVLTAHYDHIGKEGDKVFNGADDDGTGTVSLLEIAEAFQLAIESGFKPRRSILIMPVSGEEKGLLGSKYYTNNPVFPLENTVVNLNIDMIGRYDEKHKADSNYIYLIGSDKLSKDLHLLSEEVNNTYTKIGLDYTFNDENDPNRFYYRSDHYNFAKNNIPVIFYFSGVHEDYHKATDTVEKIDFEKTERVARLVFLTAWHIANREERLKVD